MKGPSLQAGGFLFSAEPLDQRLLYLLFFLGLLRMFLK